MITFNMNVYDEKWVQITLQLIRQLQEERQNAQRRLQNAQRDIEEAEHHLAALDTAMRAYRRIAGLPPDPMPAESPDEYRNLTAKEMLLKWADFHNGQIAVKEVAKGLTALGLFRTEKQALGTLYPTVRRAPHVFRQLGRGIYAPADAPVPLRTAAM
jgi:hypothetical protein